MATGLRRAFVTISACFLAAGVGGCTAVLGDFSVGPSDSGTGDVFVPGDDAGDASVEPTSDGGNDAGQSEAGDDGGPQGDASEAGGPPPVPAKPGFDLTAGGNVSSSTNFKLVGAVGESPGGNVVSQSTSYVLKGGVIAVTQ